ncbi:MAG: TonB-dependent receptor [Ignavibacteriaceae bacterium]|nr:TonB-dependent receptor [Ignavibacteriaceae bacterium]NUM70556.1 TonB-dependent receptor [Ignavibacteriaceae bacterium]
MRFFSIIFLVLIFAHIISGQSSTIVIKVTEMETGEALPGANIILEGTEIGGSTDSEGLAELKNIPDGSYRIVVSFVGYRESALEIEVPGVKAVISIELEEEAEELEEVAVTSTRTSRLIKNTPTRVEVIAGEEIGEKINMDPSGIQMILNESTGIQVQQTSALSANSSFRIQGLEGRYTQLLRNGFPLYSGFAGSLSLLQVPPLDLKQVEIIKGSSSTLFGGGAIAGLINLITKSPDPEGELSFLANVTSAGGIDLSGFYSKQFDSFGMTLLFTRNTQKGYDNNDDGFTDLPETGRYTVTPEFVFNISDNSRFFAGGSFTTEIREGGFLPLGQKIYSEKNKSSRFSAQLKYELITSNGNTLAIRNSTGYFNRELTIPSYKFLGSQVSTFTEATYNSSGGSIDWIAGMSVQTESFKDDELQGIRRDFSDLTAGTFIQAAADLSETHSAEAGLRMDYAADYDVYILPRFSLLSRWSSKITTRIGGGFGYKLPTLFTEDAEELFFRNIIPIDKKKLKSEKSLGFNFDINYNDVFIDRIAASVNNMFFYTRINDPLILMFDNSLNTWEFTSFSGYYHTMGLETNIKLSYDHFKLFTGYTFTYVRSEGPESREMPLTPRHKLGLVLFYEVHGDYRIGLEAYYTGEQSLTDGSRGRSYWINGFMIEKHFKEFSLFLNLENFLDVKQQNYGRMYTGSPGNPVFAEIYAPTDGRIINGGIKLKL